MSSPYLSGRPSEPLTRRLWEIQRFKDSGLESLDEQQAFLWVARHPNATQQDMQEAFGWTRAKTCRVVNLLTEVRQKMNGKWVDGLKFLEGVEDPDNRRFMLYSLTKKGKRLLEEIK